MSSSEVRDAVHGLIRLEPEEWKIVDTQAFQRLRGVQQLAFTHLVYPGARHSRFEHCVGACHLAGRLATELKLEDDVKRRVRLAALCHDIGHGPFSHVSEFVFEALSGADHMHERISAAIIEHDPGIGKALAKKDREWIAELLTGRGHAKKRGLERDIIAGPADIDKLDYLLRDSHYCGVEYGRYDVDKVIESARRIERTDGAYLAYHRDGVFAIEGMLLARHHMHRQVYGHKTRLATDKMLVRAMLFGVDESLLPRTVFAPDVDHLNAAFVTEYLSWDDSKTMRKLCLAPEGSKARQVAQALVDRKLLKRVATLDVDDLKDNFHFDMMAAGEAIEPKAGVLKEYQADAEAIVAEAAGVDPMWVVLDWERLQNPITSNDAFKVVDKDVLITDDDLIALDKFTEHSEIFGNVDSLGARRRVVAYIQPPEGKPFTRRKTTAIRKSMAEALRPISEAGKEV
jgi:HD superfamily phosphohydrolase